MNNYIEIADILFILFYTIIKLKYELHMMQQNSYRNKRYIKWLKNNLFTFGRISELIILVLLIVFWNNLIVLSTVALFFLWQGITTLYKKYKKPLVFTARAKRLYSVSMIIIFVIGIICSYEYTFYTSALIITFLALLSAPVMLLANIILIPCEKTINHWYYKDAARMLSEMPNLTIIGITGSYGKTSTKHYLYTILSEKFNVLMTPGSYNTTLGVIRTIREQLKPYHNVFIVEMGAKQIGDIKEICELVKPSIGIITAVGEQHLETFKTIHNVQRTKFELIDKLPKNGLAVLNNDFEYITNRPVDNLRNVIRYSLQDTSVDYYIKDLHYSAKGTTFTIQGKENNAQITTKLLGNYNISNILGAYIIAKWLGMEDRDIAYGISKIEPVEHRLCIMHTPGGITIIDDAFNSNPYGAQMALEVLKNFQQGQRIIITPGMIELGAKQYFYNQQLGRQIAANCDYAIIVGKYNQEAILKGMEENYFPPEKIFKAPTLTDAANHLKEIARTGDVVLYENDLPDTFK